MRRIEPPARPDGGTIAVVAPSSPPQTRSEIEPATDSFERLGHTVAFGPHHREVTASSRASTSTVPPTCWGAFVRFTRRKDELTDEAEEWFHRALKPEPLGRVFEDPENPHVLTIGGGRRRRRSSAAA